MANTDVSTYRRISSNTYSTNNSLSVMLWAATNRLYLEGGLEAAAFAASLRGDDFFIGQHDSNNAWASDHVVDYRPVDDTDSATYVTLAENDVAVITQGFLQLETLSDEVKIEIGYFSDATPGVTSDNQGGFTDMWGLHMEAFTGAANSSANNMQTIPFVPAFTVAQSATAGCIGFRAKINDTNVEASYGVQGFIMRDLDQVITS